MRVRAEDVALHNGTGRALQGQRQLTEALRGRLRASMVAMGASLGFILTASMLAAAGVPSTVAARLLLVALSWACFGLLLAYLFLPGFDPVPLRLITKAKPPVDAAKQQKVVALTFDDGPHPETTEGILDALARENLKATFFLVGDHVKRWPELARRIVAEGHAIGNHTQRHRLLVFRTGEQLATEIDECQETIVTTLGVRPTVFRPPHGFKPIGLHRILSRHGMRMASWQGSVRDTDGPGADVIAERVEALAAPGRILLLHDNPTNRGQSAQAIPRIAAFYRARGYSFVTL